MILFIVNFILFKKKTKDKRKRG